MSGSASRGTLSITAFSLVTAMALFAALALWPVRPAAADKLPWIPDDRQGGERRSGDADEARGGDDDDRQTYDHDRRKYKKVKTKHKKRKKRKKYKDRREDDRAEAVYTPPFGIDAGRCNRDALGAALGGLIGAAAGSQVGKGDQRTVAVIGGTILGVIVGASIGRAMDQVDQNCVGQALEHAPDRDTIVWNNTDTGAEYQVTPVKTYQDQQGTYCREYQTTIIVGGRQQQAYGTACRQPDGSWKRS